MPDPISWDGLAKTIDDPTTIDEEIDAKTLIHNQDISAHGQSNEAVYNHRIAVALDHVNYSIANLKIQTDAVDDRTIKNLKWDKAQGGTLNLGGFENINGVLVLRDETGVTRTEMNWMGMYVYRGAITIRNKNQYSILDSTGLISGGSFDNGYAEATGTQDTASSSYVDVTSLTINFTLDRACNVFFGCCLQGLNTLAKSGCLLEAVMDLGGNDLGAEMILGGVPFEVGEPGEGINPVSSSSFVVKFVPAGSHTIKVKYKAVFGGTARLVPFKRTLVFLVLGT